MVASLLTDQVHTRVAAIAARYGVSVDAALQLLQALASTGGRMAQFNHPDLGGSGQWMQGGMTMIGDMFNNSLKATVDSLCRDLAGLLAELPPQALAERGTAEGPLPEAVAHLGTPDWRGSQNEMTYAYYAAAHRLVVTRAGKTVVHDTGDHQLFGVSQQQQNGSQTLAFVGPGGVISLASLPVVAAPSEPPPAAGPAKPDTTQGPKSDVAQAGRPDIAPSGTPGRGIPEPSVLAGSLWRFSLQNVVLAEWAPALLLLAVPPRVAERAAGFPLFRPFVALPLWLVTYYTWHLPWIYDTALHHPHSLLHVEHLTYLLAGICVWWPVVHGRYSAGAKAAYLFAAFVLASPLGLLLALIPRAIYPFYVHAPRTWGPSPLADQQIAGVTMAAEEAIVFFGACTGFLLRFLADEQAAGTFNPSASAPAAGVRPVGLRAAPGSARPQH